jgi:CBS domain-containing protein
MHATEHSPGIDLNDTVKPLLAEKGDVVWSILPEASVFEAISCMSEKGVGSLVVLKSGYLVGIIT